MIETHNSLDCCNNKECKLCKGTGYILPNNKMTKPEPLKDKGQNWGSTKNPNILFPEKDIKSAVKWLKYTITDYIDSYGEIDRLSILNKIDEAFENVMGK